MSKSIYEIPAFQRLVTDARISDKHRALGADDAAKMERRVSWVARVWGKRLRCDPAHGTEDLAQELRAFYWMYFLGHGHPQNSHVINDWARAIMRYWGHRGPNGGLWANERTEKELSFSRSQLTRDFDLTDEEILDRFQYQLETGLRSSLDGEE